MKISRWIDIFYITLLGVVLGMVLSFGAVVVPTIFNAHKYLQIDISHYQEGLLMTTIFLKGNYLLNFAGIAIFLREGYDYKRFLRDKIVIASAATAIFTIFMFTLYYTPDILAYQAAGEEMTKSEIFANIHKGSEIDFMLLALSLAILLIRRLYLSLKE